MMMIDLESLARAVDPKLSNDELQKAFNEFQDAAQPEAILRLCAKLKLAEEALDRACTCDGPPGMECGPCHALVELRKP